MKFPPRLVDEEATGLVARCILDDTSFDAPAEAQQAVWSRLLIELPIGIGPPTPGSPLPDGPIPGEAGLAPGVSSGGVGAAVSGGGSPGGLGPAAVAGGTLSVNTAGGVTAGAALSGVKAAGVAGLVKGFLAGAAVLGTASIGVLAWPPTRGGPSVAVAPGSAAAAGEASSAPLATDGVSSEGRSLGRRAMGEAPQADSVGGSAARWRAPSTDIRVAESVEPRPSTGILALDEAGLGAPATAGEPESVRAFASLQDPTLVASRGSSPPSPATPSPTTASAQALAQESALLASARAALRRGDFPAAERLLRRHQEGHPQGRLGQERQAMQIELLWRSGQAAEARRQAASFGQAYPGSPHASRLGIMMQNRAPHDFDK